MAAPLYKTDALNYEYLVKTVFFRNKSSPFCSSQRFAVNAATVVVRLFLPSAYPPSAYNGASGWGFKIRSGSRPSVVDQLPSGITAP